MLGLMLCCCHFEILNNFLMFYNSAFSFRTVPHKLGSLIPRGTHLTCSTHLVTLMVLLYSDSPCTPGGVLVERQGLWNQIDLVSNDHVLTLDN